MPPSPWPNANLSISNMPATPATVYDLNWYPDSGATHHMTLDSSHLVDRIEYNGSDHVLIGNGEGLQINHVDSSAFKPFSYKYSFKLQNLLHVLHITKNLISIS